MPRHPGQLEKGVAYGRSISDRLVRPHACRDRNHRASPDAEGVTDSVGKEEAGPPNQGKPGLI